MTAKVVKLTIEKGVTFSLVVQVTTSSGVVRNITGYTATMKIRSSADNATVLADLSSYCVVSGAQGLVTVTIPKAITGAYTWIQGVYDIVIDNGTLSENILEGAISLKKLVSV